MKLGGIEPLSLLDYPGRLSAIVFTQGCNFRCPFCYNPMFVLPVNGKMLNKAPGHPEITLDRLVTFLKSRQGKLEAVVVTGGEPTLHNDLPNFLKTIKDLGFLVKLDTNGTNPEMIKKVVEEKLVDYIAMDIKAPLDKYEVLCGVTTDLEKIQTSVDFLKQGIVDYEFRTTVPKKLLSSADILEIAEWLKGARFWYLQGFVSDAKVLNPKVVGTEHYSKAELEKMARLAGEIAGHCQTRGL